MVRRKRSKGGRDEGRGPSQRQARVGELLRRTIAEILVEGLRESPAGPMGMVSVMEVRVPPDIRNADVYVSLFGDEEERTRSLENLRHAWSYISRETAARVELRYMPHLHLRLDNTMDEADRINRLLREAGIEHPSLLPSSDEDEGGDALEEEGTDEDE